MSRNVKLAMSRSLASLYRLFGGLNGGALRTEMNS